MKTTKKQKKIIIKDIINRLIILVIFSFIFFVCFKFWQSYRQSIWNGKNQLNFIVQTDEILIFSYHPEDQALNILTIPATVHFPVAKDFGDYAVAKIYSLGESQKIGGERLLSLTLQDFFAIPIDGYIIRNQKSEIRNQNEILSRGNILPLYACLVKKECRTNFTVWDLIKLSFKLRELRPGTVKTTSFTKTGLLKEEVLADGSLILTPDYLKIDQLALSLFSDKVTYDENLSIGVLNGTNQEGLAKTTSRLVKNLGVDLIYTGDTDKPYNQSIIYYQDKKVKASYTLKRLAEIFQIKKIELNDKIEGDIVLVLGEDLNSLH